MGVKSQEAAQARDIGVLRAGGGVARVSRAPGGSGLAGTAILKSPGIRERGKRGVSAARYLR